MKGNPVDIYVGERKRCCGGSKSVSTREYRDLKKNLPLVHGRTIAQNHENHSGHGNENDENDDDDKDSEKMVPVALSAEDIIALSLSTLKEKERVVLEMHGGQ